jgi:hypothetical protein
MREVVSELRSTMAELEKEKKRNRNNAVRNAMFF